MKTAAGKGDGTGRILPKNGEDWNNKGAVDKMLPH